MAIRAWYVQQALESYPRLMDLLDQLTEEEVLHCLKVEAGSRKRRSLIDRLISRAVRLKEIVYSRQLKEKFHGTSQAEPHPRRNQDHEG